MPAGKTTLLDALAGRKSGKDLEGRVLLNGRPAGKWFRRLSQYVPQEDAFVATQTALETVAFRAALTIPSTVSKKERKQRVHSVIEILGLLKVKDTKVGLLPCIHLSFSSKVSSLVFVLSAAHKIPFWP